MFAARMLVILSAPIDAVSAANEINCALRMAAAPDLLRFALPASLKHQMPPDESLLFYDQMLDGADYVSLLTNETHFLMLTGAHAFAQRWDRLLLNMLRAAGGVKTLLTGSVSHSGRIPSPVPAADDNAPTRRITAIGAVPESKLSEKTPEMHLPALGEVLADGAIEIAHGLPVVCPVGPICTMLIDPHMVFGPTSFLREGEPAARTLSLAAYAAGWSVFVMPEVVAWPLQKLPRGVLKLPLPEQMPGTTLLRFEKLLGLRGEQTLTAVKASMGLFGPEETYAQRMPVVRRIRQYALSARMRISETYMPLLVGAYADLPSAGHPPAYYTLRFGFLRRIQSLPLLLFTGGSQERALRASFPNTQSYPDRSHLPRMLLHTSMTPRDLFARCKPFLLQRALRSRPEFTHVAWVDMDVLPHPVCGEAVPDFAAMMDDRIHMAAVGGVPDLSFVVIPRDMIAAVAKETANITQLDAELRRGLGEELLWERMFQRHPQWFAIHPMPARRLLFLSAFDPALLCCSCSALLQNVPPAYRAGPEDVSSGNGKTFVSQ